MQLHAIHTACGIETKTTCRIHLTRFNCMQSIPLAVLKLRNFQSRDFEHVLLHAIHTACGVEKGQICAESLRG